MKSEQFVFLLLYIILCANYANILSMQVLLDQMAANEQFEEQFNCLKWRY